jgi:periplasmic divalent cation tolerance protein
MTMSDTDAVLFYTTFPSLDEAERCGRALVEARLAACVNIIPGMTAIFEWQGEIQTASETVMIIKSKASLQEQVFELLKSRHSYTTPAFLVLKAHGGSEDFLAWIMHQTTRTMAS